MPLRSVFLNDTGRLRSGWRFLIFIALLLPAFFAIGRIVITLLHLVAGPRATILLNSNWGFVVQSVMVLASSTVVGWVCGKLLEGLPVGALGWALHRRWWRDFLFGSIFGAGSLLLAAAIATAFGGFGFHLQPSEMIGPTCRTLLATAVIFIASGAGEEAAFRGYPLQTFVRSWPAWLALLPSSTLFAAAHLSNPNVVPGFSFLNTLLAGVWLAAAYLRTRSLWFPLGIHWSWNWTMGAVLGLPVSGIESLAAHPLIAAAERGPEWLTGGAYGIEGGAACTIALVISTCIIARTRLVHATDEMLQFSESERAGGKGSPVVIG